MMSDVVDEIGTRTKRRCRELVTKTAIPHIDESDESRGGFGWRRREAHAFVQNMITTTSSQRGR